jgi:hypothetical protein
VSLVRILIWNLADSRTTLEEVREHLPRLPDVCDAWIANDPQERFGLVSVGGQLPELETLRTLIGKDPDFVEEFDVLA